MLPPVPSALVVFRPVSLLDSTAFHVLNNPLSVISQWISYGLLGTYFLLTNYDAVGNVFITLKPPP